MFFINPFIYAAGADFESIATVTVGSGGASSIEFTSIPGTYQHLQVRGVARRDDAFATGSVYVQVNSDTGSNYAYHVLNGDGSSASASAGSSAAFMFLGQSTANGAASSIFAAYVADLLDYASTSKTKVLRAMGAHDSNGSGNFRLLSGLWNSTSAVTSLKLYPSTAGVNFVQHTTFALYGIKAP